jgi:hypothetical protein
MTEINTASIETKSKGGYNMDERTEIMIALGVAIG